MTHIGVRIRLTIPAGVIYECDSDRAHYQALYGAAPAKWCDPTCLPNCTTHGWADLTAGLMAGLGADLKVEIKAVQLDDQAVDDDEADGDDERCMCLCSNCSGCLGG